MGNAEYMGTEDSKVNKFRKYNEIQSNFFLLNSVHNSCATNPYNVSIYSIFCVFIYVLLLQYICWQLFNFFFLNFVRVLYGCYYYNECLILIIYQFIVLFVITQPRRK